MAYNKLEMDSNLKKTYEKLKLANSLSLVMIDLENAMNDFVNIRNQEFEGTAKDTIMNFIENISKSYEKIEEGTEKIISATNKTNNNLFPTLEKLDKKIEEYNAAVDEYNNLESQKRQLTALLSQEENTDV